ncbi:LOG family protein [Aquihabitans sp. McL0605]|uniref:LOG family protein n=1 Tax=Aquihabitans sp. McL0605 TaxID=3415671 RepID=UPI003CEB3DF6
MEDVFPVLPFRSELYSPDELFAGFSVDDPASYASTPDFRAYRSTLLAPNREVGMLRALHDQSVTEQRTTLLEGRRVVAIMGGHAMARDDAAYQQVATLARSLTRDGVLVVSGGGPGAMEATHLGAVLANAGDLALTSALADLATVPDFPPAAGLVAPGGVVDIDMLAAIHRWQVPAFRLLAELDPGGRGESLAIPTWFYGHEPPTPFASHIAKYFSNPLREDGLLSIAVDGVVYAPGSAGTVQEIFQDATQNVYRVVDGRFSPMAFLDTDACWSERLPVLPVLQALFGDPQYRESVVVTPEPGEILAFLERR